MSNEKTQFNEHSAVFAASLHAYSREELEYLFMDYFEAVYQIRKIIPNGEKYLLLDLPSKVGEAVMKLPKIPIDHLKADSGAAPFDGVEVLGLDYMGDIMAISYCNFSNSWETTGGLSFHLSRFTSYTPMPEFFEQKGGE